MDDPKDIMESIHDIFNELQRDAINFSWIMTIMNLRVVFFISRSCKCN